MVAHPFHIHDIQFYVLDINSVPPPPQYQGLKDVILVEPGDTVRFITQFTTFSNFFVPYMYHCHLLHHEDEGMMGSFLVIDTTQLAVGANDVAEPRVLIYPNPAGSTFTIETEIPSGQLNVYNLQGAIVHRQILAGGRTDLVVSWVPGIYLLEIYTGESVIRRRVVIQ
jgi:blue copper oxidase